MSHRQQSAPFEGLSPPPQVRFIAFLSPNSSSPIAPTLACPHFTHAFKTYYDWLRLAMTGYE